jgi:hypothetical protein
MVLLRTVVPAAITRRFAPILGAVVGLYILINGLYFTHLIPPIPLALRTAGVYHLVTKGPSGNYTGEGEPRTWKEVVGLAVPVFHRAEGESIYFYSAVFTPVQITTPIVHDWEYQNTSSGTWTSLSRVTFPISGGRREGYRGYSIKENAPDGTWRVSVETSDGVLLGREVFTVVSVATGTPLTLSTSS